MYNTKEELLVAVFKCLPYSDQISDLDFSNEKSAIRFIWRTNKFRVSLSGNVEEYGNGVLSTTDICILFRKLLENNG